MLTREVGEFLENSMQYSKKKQLNVVVGNVFNTYNFMIVEQWKVWVKIVCVLNWKSLILWS
jgi:hypothetical protein